MPASEPATSPSIVCTRGSARLALATCGVLCVGVGGVGVVVPGLPTTIFLIAACWCFARSSPALEQRLVRNRYFSPYLRYLVPGVRMPRRAKIITLAVMWLAITISMSMIAAGAGFTWPIALVALLGVVGSVCIVRYC